MKITLNVCWHICMAISVSSSLIWGEEVFSVVSYSNLT